MRHEHPIRAIVADDHPAVIKGVIACLERDRSVSVVATARNTFELAEAVDSTPCDFVISDIGMEGIDGENSSITFLRRLSWLTIRPKLIVLTMIAQSQMLAGLIQIGIDGVIDKRDGLGCLPSAMAAIRQGRRYVSPGVQVMIDALPAHSPARAGVLSRREWEVFRLYASGLLIPEIAARFGRSSKTIATQKRNGMRKLGLDTELQLVEFFRQVGLV